MGYAFCMGSCGGCGRLFTFNPNKVPSHQNVPFCRSCIEAANKIRGERGLPPHHIPDDAYEPVDEQELR